MLILALETTADVCSVAVTNAGTLLASRAFEHRMQLSQRLMGEADSALSEAGATMDNVEGFAVGIGPGSFTGVRVGVTTVKVWARLLGKPVAGIDSLHAIAHTQLAPVKQDLVVPLIRARPGLVYAAAFRTTAGNLELMSEPAAVEPANLMDQLLVVNGTPCLFCGPGLAEARSALVEAAIGRVKPEFGSEEGPGAVAVARIAYDRLRAGLTDDPLELVPLYIQPPPIRIR